MKMKKLILILSVIFIAYGCGEEFTTQAPQGILADENLQNSLGVNLLLTSAYSALDGINGKGGSDWSVTGDNWWFDVIADDAHKGSTDGDQAELFNLETFTFNTNDPYISGKWSALYSGANRANAVINVGSAEALDGDPEVAQAVAEAYFLRGHYYFELQKIWGNPAYIDEISFAATEFNVANTGDIWEKIESDFAYAKANLAATSSDPGRPNATTATAFLGKVMLFQSKYAAALAEFNAVIASGKYGLNADYVDNFNIAGENSSESVFAIQFAADAGLSNNGNRGGTLNFPGGGPLNTCCGFYQPTIDLASAFKTVAGLPMLDTYHDTPITNDYGIASADAFTPHAGDLDIRIDYTMGRRGVDFNGFGINPGADWVRATPGDISGPHLGAKNHYRANELANRGSGGWGEERAGINYNIMRYADVLLMAAECEVEVGSLETARGYVNQIRTRAAASTPIDITGATTYNVTDYTTAWNDQAIARDAVRFERRLELAMEGHRFFDLKRWGVLKTTLDSYVLLEAVTIANFGTKAKSFGTHMVDLPIPLGAIDLSLETLTQNTGY
tara:strand:+ start:3099 stop:4784 length:1686 start_codon:yes stop_codon:yes gene_type:complete